VKGDSVVVCGWLSNRRCRFTTTAATGPFSFPSKSGAGKIGSRLTPGALKCFWSSRCSSKCPVADAASPLPLRGFLVGASRVSWPASLQNSDELRVADEKDGWWVAVSERCRHRGEWLTDPRRARLAEILLALIQQGSPARCPDPRAALPFHERGRSGSARSRPPKDCSPAQSWCPHGDAVREVTKAMGFPITCRSGEARPDGHPAMELDSPDPRGQAFAQKR
jgi:hypothetical protein